MRKITWLDKAIDSAIASKDATQIAQAIANNPRFVSAINKGLNTPSVPNTLGLSPSQIIADAVKEEISAD